MQTIVTSDNVTFEVDEVKMKSGAFGTTLVDLAQIAGASGIIPLNGVDSKTFRYITRDKREVDVSDLTDNEVFDVCLAANFLAYEPLLDACCHRIGCMIKGKEPDEVRRIFGVENEFAKGEQEKALAEHAWCIYKDQST